MKLSGKTVLEHTLDIFERHAAINEIILVVSSESRQLAENIVIHAGYRKITKIVNGGTTRQASSAAGIAAVDDDQAKVLVHDAVRPLLDANTINRCLDALDEYDAVDTGIPSPDTVIQLGADDCIVGIPARAQLRLGQTPQGFRAGLLRKAHALAELASDLNVTDDCGLILHFKLGQVRVVAGDVNNIKITYPSDIYLADRLFQLRSHSTPKIEDKELNGKVLVIIGASKGIGFSIAKVAKESGAHVIAVSRKDGVDVRNAESIRRTLNEAIKQYGRVDYLVNTAGVLRTGLLAGQSDSVLDEQISINLRGCIVAAREAFSVMQETGGSIALFTSSSYTRGRAYSAVYSATKAAVVNLMQGLAEEYLPFGVRINAINPERTATPMRSENFGIEPKDSLLDADIVAQSTLGALLSDSTGQVIDVRR